MKIYVVWWITNLSKMFVARKLKVIICVRFVCCQKYKTVKICAIAWVGCGKLEMNQVLMILHKCFMILLLVSVCHDNKILPMTRQLISDIDYWIKWETWNENWNFLPSLLKHENPVLATEHISKYREMS